MATKIAVVTGANKGIGYGIVRGLCKRFDGIVYLTSRDSERGKKAVAELNKEGLNPSFHQLDITDNRSIELFRDYIKSKYEGIDVLVNNAAMAFTKDSPVPVTKQAKETVFVNYFSLVSVCDILFPILKRGARVINLSSSYGHLSVIPGESIKNRFKDPNLTVAELSKMMHEYVDAAQEGKQAAEWGNSSYGVSKVGVAALSFIQQRMVNDRDIKVNAVHPGYVATDMSSHKGPLSVDQGAASSLYLALDAPSDLRGKYVWYNKELVDWYGEKPDDL